MWQNSLGQHLLWRFQWMKCNMNRISVCHISQKFWLSSAYIAYGSNTYYWRIGNPHWLYIYAMNAMGGNLVSQISDHLPQFLIVNHRMIICFFKSVHTTQDGIRLSVTLVHYLPTLGILYLLMSGKCSRFLVFVKISRILWLMVIIALLIPEVLWLYYL